MKQALKSINIPRSPVKYAVINRDEQSAIFRVDESIKEVENMIISNKNEYGEDRLHSDRDRILRLFDSIHSMVNRQKEEVMTTLEKSFEAKRLKNQELVQYLDDAKRTKMECRQMIVDDTGFEDIQSRNQRVIRLSEECLNNLDHILQNDMAIEVRTNLDMNQMVKVIEELVTIDVAQKQSNPKDRNNSHKIKRSDRSDRSSPSISKRTEHKEEERSTYSNENNKENINASNLSTNESYHSIYSNRSTPHHQDPSSVTESLSNFKFANTQNLSGGEGFGSFTDQHTKWDTSALTVQSATVSPPKSHSRHSNLTSTRSHSVEEDNCSEITFKPVVDLQEQDVDSGHEDERLLSSFPVKTLYIWGEDVTGSLVWKSRASQTELTFYIRRDGSKARLVCRETKTSKLRLNHYVPPREIAKMSSNSERSWVWLAYDTTNEDDYRNDQYTTFCAKFPDSKS